MFPLNSNLPYIKDDGTRDKLGNVIGSGGGGGSEIPEYTIADAGKVLGVDDEGDLAWVTVSGSSFRRGLSQVSGNVVVSGKEVTNAN